MGVLKDAQVEILIAQNSRDHEYNIASRILYLYYGMLLAKDGRARVTCEKFAPLSIRSEYDCL